MLSCTSTRLHFRLLLPLSLVRNTRRSFLRADWFNFWVFSISRAPARRNLRVQNNINGINHPPLHESCKLFLSSSRLQRRAGSTSGNCVACQDSRPLMMTGHVSVYSCNGDFMFSQVARFASLHCRAHHWILQIVSTHHVTSLWNKKATHSRARERARNRNFAFDSRLRRHEWKPHRNLYALLFQPRTNKLCEIRKCCIRFEVIKVCENPMKYYWTVLRTT